MPCEPGSPRRVDPFWAGERNCALALGHDVLLLDHDALERGDTRQALARTGLDAARGRTLAWRGWMVRAENYAALDAAVQAAGCRLLDTPDAYAACHHAPVLLAALRGLTAPAHVLPLDRSAGLDAFLLSRAGVPSVLKDWVKSQSGLWDQACFIPDPGDLPAARRVVERFLDLQGASLTGGLVLRDWVELVLDPGGRPAEWRTFVVDGAPVTTFRRTPGVPTDGPSRAVLDGLVPRVPARFWCMDHALRPDGTWLLLEVGYGGVSSLPDGMDPAPVLSAAGAATE